MSQFWLFEVIKEKKAGLVGTGILVSVLAVLSLFLFNPRYEVRTDFLVSQEEVASKDYYTLARSSEYIGKILGEVSSSERFISAVVDTGKISPEFLPFDKKKRIEAWQKMMKMSQELDLGILHVTVFSNDPKEALRVSQAVAQVLIEKNGALLGTADKNIPMSILSGPITEGNPSGNEIMLVAIAGFVFGIVLSFLVIFLKQEVGKQERI